MRHTDLPPPTSNELAALATDDAVQREKLSVIGHMTSSVAHDLSNPLASIAASAQAILVYWPHYSATEWMIADPSMVAHESPLVQLHEDLELILTEAKRAGDILANLLAFARQEEPEWRPASLADIVRRSVTLTRHHLTQYDITLETAATLSSFGNPPWCWVQGNASRLQQVLMNLIINAQQAITDGGTGERIWIRLEPRGDGVGLTIEDDGPGVPADLHQTIFRPFYTTKKNGQGTGLGLSISAGVVGAHGGQLAVSDREEGGARFVISLPTCQPPENTRQHEHGRDLSALRSRFRRRGSRGRILLVDDEPGIRRSIGRFLRRYGCEVETAITGEEALAALARSEFNAIISDLRMPGLDGEDLFRVVQQGHPHMTSKIVFMSGDMMRPETRAFLAHCGCPSLQKPYELADLIQILDQYCPVETSTNPAPAA